LRFVHQMAAGVSNLMPGDVWKGAVPVTSGRGAGNVAPIAEWTMAAILALSKEYPRAFAQRRAGRFDRQVLHGRQVAGTTVGVIGLGGIGQHVARLAQGLGMRALGMRRSSQPVEYVERLYGPSDLHALLSQCDHVVISAQYTDETYHMLNEAAFAAMKPGAFLVNVARGELIDEPALIAALESGHLGGFAADVYEGEFERPPRSELIELENVILTPHTSGQAQNRSTGALEILQENLRRCLAGEPLVNLVYWERGY
jgi:phosphoglycerate dehydrogenase-like enzyme